MLSVHDHDHDEKLNGADELPSPVSSPLPRPTPAGKAKLSATAIIPVWICLSSAVIIYNNYLYNTLNFRYPVFLVTWHLTFAVRYEGFLPLLNPFVRSVSSLPPFFFFSSRVASLTGFHDGIGDCGLVVPSYARDRLPLWRYLHRTGSSPDFAMWCCTVHDSVHAGTWESSSYEYDCRR